MLSGTLIHLIEAHQEEIADRVIYAVHHDPDMAHMIKLPELELRHRSRRILERLGDWLAAGNENELANEYEAIGRTRCEESIPLHECARTLCIIKDKMIDFVKEQGLTLNSLELYAEEELEYAVDHFFDTLIIHLVRGYESAWHRTPRVAF